MEKRLTERTALKRILVTGPESTGKTELAAQLAEHFGGRLIEEYARKYVEKLKRPYTYEDVEHIAQRQVEDYNRVGAEQGWVFFDTWLVITRVWFDVVYGSIPSWLDAQLDRAHFDLVLLCAPDIPWIPDPVRENGGAMRLVLFERYKEELERFGFPWELVEGSGEARSRRIKRLLTKLGENGTF
jgi:NadR type nicotinamide-nucleotide adenylyltransferase